MNHGAPSDSKRRTRTVWLQGLLGGLAGGGCALALSALLFSLSEPGTDTVETLGQVGAAGAAWSGVLVLVELLDRRLAPSRLGRGGLLLGGGLMATLGAVLAACWFTALLAGDGSLGGLALLSSVVDLVAPGYAWVVCLAGALLPFLALGALRTRAGRRQAGWRRALPESLAAGLTGLAGLALLVAAGPDALLDFPRGVLVGLCGVTVPAGAALGAPLGARLAELLRAEVREVRDLIDAQRATRLPRNDSAPSTCPTCGQTLDEGDDGDEALSFCYHCGAGLQEATPEPGSLRR